MEAKVIFFIKIGSAKLFIILLLLFVFDVLLDAKGVHIFELLFVDALDWVASVLEEVY